MIIYQNAIVYDGARFSFNIIKTKCFWSELRLFGLSNAWNSRSGSRTRVPLRCCKSRRGTPAGCAFFVRFDFGAQGMRPDESSRHVNNAHRTPTMFTASLALDVFFLARSNISPLDRLIFFLVSLNYREICNGQGILFFLSDTYSRLLFGL